MYKLTTFGLLLIAALAQTQEELDAIQAEIDAATAAMNEGLADMEADLADIGIDINDLDGGDGGELNEEEYTDFIRQ